MGKKLEILKGNDKYSIIRNNSNNLLYLTLTDGLFTVGVEKGLGALSSFKIMTNRVNVTQKSYLGKQ